MPKIAITGAGTDIGKSYISGLLLRYWRQRGLKVQPLKPVVSGWDGAESDTHNLLMAAGLEVTEQAIAACSPWRYEAALAPNQAAALEGTSVPWDEVREYPWRQCYGEPYYTLFEGVGGVMAPVSDDAHMLHWLQALHWPVLLVGGTYLGAMSHLLTAFEAVKSTELCVLGCVINESDAEASVGLNETIDALQPFVNVPIWGVERHADVDGASVVLNDISKRMVDGGE